MESLKKEKKRELNQREERTSELEKKLNQYSIIESNIDKNKKIIPKIDDSYFCTTLLT
jgi:transcription elongation GreA/GreB family factor